MPWKGLPPHRIASSRVLLGTEGNAAMPWEGLPPHRIVSSFVVFCGNDMSFDMSVEFSGKSWGTMVKFCPHDVL